MMTANRIHSQDISKVQVEHADGRKETVEISGQHDIAGVIRAAYGMAGGDSIETDVFRITDRNTGVTSSYRINAHGNVYLIV